MAIDKENNVVGFSARVKPEVKNYVYAEASRLGLTIGDAMNYIIERAQANSQPTETIQVVEKLFTDDSLNKLQSITADKYETPQQQLDWLLSYVPKLETALVDEQNKPAITETKEVEVIKTVAIALEKNQFICTLPDAEATKLRKCRKFLIQDGRIKPNAEPNEMIPMFVNYYLDNKYDHILNPLFR